MRNLAELYRPLVQRWRLLENAGETPHLVAEEQDGRLEVSDVPLLAQIEREASIRIMPELPPFSVEEPSVFQPDANTRASMRAMRKAFADAVLENLRFGLPVIQYRDGKVVEVPAEDLAPFARRILAANGELLPEESAPRRVG